MTDTELIALLDRARNIMVSVATGGPSINSVNQEFQSLVREIDIGLDARGIENTIPFRDLWQWHGRWSSDLPTWASRRTFVADLFEPILKRIRSGSKAIPVLTGWARVDRNVGEVRRRLETASAEEHFQTVGLLCREALISLAIEVYDPLWHPILDAANVSETDFKRKIEAYIAEELRGSAADECRKHARSALDLAVKLQHQRTANFRDAAICSEATISVVNIIAIVSGRRGP